MMKNKCFEIRVKITTAKTIPTYDFSYLCDTEETAREMFSMVKLRSIEVIKKLTDTTTFNEFDEDKHFKMSDGWGTSADVCLNERKIYKSKELKKMIPF